MENYILVPWPKVQDYMDEQWFYDEAIVAVEAEDKVSPSAYLWCEGTPLQTTSMQLLTRYSVEDRCNGKCKL